MNLIGKLIDKGEGYQVWRMPFWCSHGALCRAAAKVMDDPDSRPVKITVDGRVMRVEDP